MNKKYNLAQLLTIVFLAMTVTFSLTMMISTNMFEERVSSVTQKESLYDKLSSIDAIVRQNYLFEIDETTLYDNMASGYIRGLSDIESRYYSQSEMQTLQEIQQGKTFGLGLEIYKSKDHMGYMYIYNVQTGSPADIQGIAEGELISMIDGVSTAQMTIETAQGMLESDEARNIIFEIVTEEEAIKRASEAIQNTQAQAATIAESEETQEDEEATDSVKTVELIHALFDTEIFTSSKYEDYGYIDIDTFVSSTASDFEYSVNNLISQSVKGLVIDLRGNSSKEFSFAAQVADIIVKEGTIMSAMYLNGETKVLYTSSENSVELPIVILTDENTGYAAEMLTIILKDSTGAKTVGKTTMGKGTLQAFYRLSDGSGIELTTAQLVPTVSQNYDGVGIKADYELIETVEVPYEVPFEEDAEVLRAFEVLQNLGA